MRVPFDDWLEQQELSPDAEGLFQEAVTCYAASAYRAALLFSYLGFQTVLRDRLLAADCPSGIPTDLWSHIHSSLRDESQWDTKVFETTQQQQPAPIFDIPQELRKQVDYWKNRRNDCAHFRRNEIGPAHVESYWLFIRSNLARFVVIGSSESLIRRIRDHFDPSITPPGTPADEIAADVPLAVDAHELTDFLSDAQDVFDNLSNSKPAFRKKNALIFYEALANLNDNDVDEALVDFLEQRPSLLVAFLRKYPWRVQLLSSRATLIRRLWYDLLFSNGHQDLPVFSCLLRTGLIPDDQIEEAVNRVVERVTEETPRDEDAEVLANAGFFAQLRKRAFEDMAIDEFEWANSKAEILVWTIDKHGVDETAVEAISEVFFQSHYPYDLGGALGSYFEGNDEKRREFLDIVERLGLSRPRKIDAFRVHDQEDDSQEDDSLPF